MAVFTHTVMKMAIKEWSDGSDLSVDIIFAGMWFALFTFQFTAITWFLDKHLKLEEHTKEPQWLTSRAFHRFQFFFLSHSLTWRIGKWTSGTGNTTNTPQNLIDIIAITYALTPDDLILTNNTVVDYVHRIYELKFYIHWLQTIQARKSRKMSKEKKIGWCEWRKWWARVVHWYGYAYANYSRSVFVYGNNLHIFVIWYKNAHTLFNGRCES